MGAQKIGWGPKIRGGGGPKIRKWLCFFFLGWGAQNSVFWHNIHPWATDEELDMLDLAFGLTETSRLGCQVCVSKELSGITVRVPEGVNDQLW